MKLYEKLRRTDWEKEKAMQSIFQRLTDEFGGAVLKDLPFLNYFMPMHSTISGSSAYGFKWKEMQLNYHKVPSKNTTEVQFRWSAVAIMAQCDPESSKRHLSDTPPGRQAKDDDDRPAKAKKKEAKPRAAQKSKRKEQI